MDLKGGEGKQFLLVCVQIAGETQSIYDYNMNTDDKRLLSKFAKNITNLMCGTCGLDFGRTGHTEFHLGFPSIAALKYFQSMKTYLILKEPQPLRSII